MMDNEQEPNKKKKKRDLSSKMGLNQGSDMHAPPMAQPGLFPGSAEGELNSRNEEQAVGAKVKDKLNRRPNGR
jgi:hypothetical protein